MRELNKNYDPKSFESRIYDYWVSNSLFKPEVNGDSKPYTVMMPPPNVTANLHLGHSLYVYQDIFIRYKRMLGYSALWLPGTDHASIATESKVVEKLKKQGLSKEDVGRDGFLEATWEWTHEHGGNIIKQLKRLGSSCDWDRLCFTLDEKFYDSVLESFVRLYDDGLIYRGDRIINWCPNCKTAISDAEVNHVESDSFIWEIKYPLVDSDDFLVVATTRPETMLGDLAVAVNPNDDRYKSYVGKKVLLPLVNREIPIISDEYVDMEFGTGVVKITPSHDPNDFEVGNRHSLGQLLVIGYDGKMNENAGIYSGLDRYDARKAIISDLKSNNLLVSEKKHNNNVGHCDRCKTVIEPILSKQWFVRMEELAKKCLVELDNGRPRFHPKRFEKIYRNWLEGIKDWCISRQLWWGHQLPVYYCKDCGHIHVSKENIDVCEKCGSKNVYRDPDTLDTWFSSALWPFATFGWPNLDAPDLKKFFPTDLLVTGYDIIFFWVIRMVFSSLWYLDEVPFKDVMLTGLVRDAEGRKMSKTLGNGIDPLEIIEEFGADALRYSLVIGNSLGNDFRFDVKKVENSRNFANKVWNATRFLMMHLDDDSTEVFDEEKLQPKDVWIIDRLNQAIDNINLNLDKYEVGVATDYLYSFVWEDFCDYYIEFSKSILFGDDLSNKNTTKSVLLYILNRILKLLHPFMPFITEEIYQVLPGNEGSIMISKWPTKYNFTKFDEKDLSYQIELVKSIIKSIRNAKSVRNIDQFKKSRLFIKADDGISNCIKSNANLIESLANITDIEFIDSNLNPLEFLFIALPNIDLYLPLKDLINYEEELNRLMKESERLKDEIKRFEGKLSNASFVNKAPKEIVDKEKQKLEDAKNMLSTTLNTIKEIKNLL